MGITVSHLIHIMNEIAPPNLSESWDNSGLQVGDGTWPVRKILLALDPSTEVIQTACRNKVDLLITHHPLIFKAIKSIDLKTSLGGILHACLHHKLAVFTAHTNYDSVSGGVNDILAKKIGLTELSPLQPTQSGTPDKYKFVVFAPAEYQDRIMEVLFQSGCGQIGNYSGCSFSVNGKGTFKPEKGSNPWIGNRDLLNHVDEVKIEAILEKGKMAETIQNVKKVHPYETVAYDIYPLFSSEISESGLGRVGELPVPVSFERFVSTVKSSLKVQTVKTAGSLTRPVKKVAVCSGSGSTLLNLFFQSGADCYVSGDLHYHDAKSVEENDRAMIDIGHFASEQVVLDDLKEKLRTIFSERKIGIDIECCDLEKDPFRYM